MRMNVIILYYPIYCEWRLKDIYKKIKTNVNAIYCIDCIKFYIRHLFHSFETMNGPELNSTGTLEELVDEKYQNVGDSYDLNISTTHFHNKWALVICSITKIH